MGSSHRFLQPHTSTAWAVVSHFANDRRQKLITKKYHTTSLRVTRRPIVQADSGSDSDSESWRQSAHRMSFVGGAIQTVWVRRCTGMISSFLFPTLGIGVGTWICLNYMRTQTVGRKDFLILVPTLGIGVGTWICLHYTRTLTITCKYPSSPSSPSLRKVHNIIWSESPDSTIRHSSFNFHYLLVSLELSSHASFTSSSSCLSLLPRLLSLYHSFYLSFNNPF